MTGKSHVAAAAVLSWVAFQNPFICAAAICAAKLPDQMESFIPGVKHRGPTHVLIFWFFAAAVLGSGLFIPGVPALSLGGMDVEFHSILFGIALGGLLHVCLDYLSVSGIPVFPGKSRPHAAARWYKTGHFSEYLVLGLIILLSAVVLFVSDEAAIERVRKYLTDSGFFAYFS